MDFYITKYQGKPMEALTPLFQAMTSGVHRLEQQEREEEKRAQVAATNDDANAPVEPAAKQRKTLEGLVRRARRLTIRLAAMANRCYWLSATEVAVHLLTGGDCLQSHQHQRLFTRQLQWALHECKRAMNGEKDLEDCLERPPPLDAVAVQVVQTNPETVARRRLRGKQTEGSSHGGAAQPPAPSRDESQQCSGVASDLDATSHGESPAELANRSRLCVKQPDPSSRGGAAQPAAQTPDDSQRCGGGAREEGAATQDESDADFASDNERSQDDEGEACTEEDESGTNLASDNERSQDDEDEVCTEEDEPDDEGRRSAGRQRAAVEIMTTTACTTSTNAADDYAHRGRNLQAMPYYMYRMYVRRVRRGRQKAVPGGRLFEFEPHYALARSYAQRIRLDRMNIPTIDGFQCPTWTQDAEQNSMFKAMLFTPWSCRDALACGCVSKFEHLLSNGACGELHSGTASSGKYTFKRGWRVRCSHLHILAERAEARSVAARKALVLADTTLFAQIKEPWAQLATGVRILQSVRAVSCSWANGSAWPAQALRTMLLHVHDLYPWHEQQCTLAEYCAYIARDVVAHIDLASEARVKPSVKKEAQEEVAEDDSSDGGDEDQRRAQALEFEDIGGGDAGDVVEDGEDVPVTELSAHPLRDHQQALAMAFQHDRIQELDHKLRLSHEDRSLQQLDRVYGPMMREHLGFPGPLPGIASELRYQGDFDNTLALQKRNVELLKKQLIEPEEGSDAEATGGATQPAATDDQSLRLIPLSLAMQGPGAAAWELVTSAKCTDEQIDAVALLAQSMQKRFDSRTDKTTHRLPVATTEHNHRAVWLGGGGVGKTRTLRLVVEPLAVTYFGEAGYMATAQANHAAQNLGPRGRTIHAATGLLAHDSLQTAKLRLNEASHKKLDRLVGTCGVDVIDELGCVSGSLLHADALRKTYGRSLRYNLCATAYMQPQETWGRMAAKILCGDFLQLPPVPASSSLIADTRGQTYEHQQGRKILADMEHVIDFVQMQRFTDPLLLEVLDAMRTPGGKQLTDAAWRAIEATQLEPEDPRLRNARGWYESAYEWRFVSYAMHAHAKLDARAAGKLLYYIPAVDRASAPGIGKAEFDEMRAEPNISKTRKLPGLLPVFEGMEMVLEETLLPPKYVRGCRCKVVGIELHPREPLIEGRESIATDGCVVLVYMPKCVYVRVDGSNDVFLLPRADFDIKGVLAVAPKGRPWQLKSPKRQAPMHVTRTQITLLPRKQCTLHGVQGKTATPGFIVYWRYPARLSPEARWLAHYVSLSRPPSLKQLLSHGLPDRHVIERGPPEDWLQQLDELFREKIATTKVACAKARRELGWPPRGAAPCL